MALTFTSPSDDIVFHEGVSAYNFQASGTILGGQLVYVNDTMKVAAVDAADKVGIIGVSAYDVTDDEYVAIWGRGNIVRCKSSGALNVGSCLSASLNGGVQKPPNPFSGARVDSRIGVALESVATNTEVRVLLV